MTPLLANSGPSGWVETIIAGSTMIVAIIFGLSGIVFRYRPASIAGGVVAFLVVVFLFFCAQRYDTPGKLFLLRVAVFPLVVGVALLVFKRAPKKSDERRNFPK